VYDHLAALELNRSQNDLFGLISGQNLGDLLVKDYYNRPLTEAEIAFVSHWNSERTVRMGAFGMFLQSNCTAPIDRLDRAIALAHRQH